MDQFTQFDDQLASRWELALTYEKTRWPFYTFAWHDAWYTHIGSRENLVVLSDPKTSVIIPLAITDSIAHFTGGEEIADYLDALGPVEKKGHAWTAALPLLKRLGATELLLRNVPAGSSSIPYFENIESAQISEEDTTPILTLQSSYDTYLTSLGRKERHELKRKNRRFEEEHPNITFTQMEPSNIGLLITLMRKNVEKNTFLSHDMEEFFRSLLRTSEETLVQFALMKGVTCVATTAAFRVDNSLLLYNSGYDPEVEGSGWYLKTKIIEWAIAERLHAVNFLQGGERYKYDLGASDFSVYRIQCPL